MARHAIDGLMIIRWLEVWGMQGKGQKAKGKRQKARNVCIPPLCLMHEQNSHKPSMFAALL